MPAARPRVWTTRFPRLGPAGVAVCWRRAYRNRGLRPSGHAADRPRHPDAAPTGVVAARRTPSMPFDAQGRTVSDDGRYWWNGTQWLPIDALAQAQSQGVATYAVRVVPTNGLA